MEVIAWLETLLRSKEAQPKKPLPLTKNSKSILRLLLVVVASLFSTRIISFLFELIPPRLIYLDSSMNDLTPDPYRTVNEDTKSCTVPDMENNNSLHPRGNQ